MVIQTKVLEVPRDWDRKKIGEIAKLSSGQFLPTSKQKSGKIPVYGGNGITGFHNESIMKIPTIIIGRVGAYCGSVYLSKENSWITDNAIFFKKYSEIIEIDYLYRFLSNININLLSDISAQPKINQNILNNITIYFPRDKKEQQKIISIFSNMDQLIDSLESLIQKKKNIKQGAMQELLTGKRRLEGFSGEWESKTLDKVANFFSGGTPLTSISEYYGGEIPWIVSGDLNSRFIIEVNGRITEKGLNNSSAKMVKENTLLIALYGATAGVVAISLIRASINQAVLAIIPCSIDTKFLFYKLEFLKDWIITTYTQGGQPNLSANIIKSIKMEFPSEDEQEAISKILLDMDSEIQQLENQLNKYINLKQAMMQKLLTGEIRLV